MNDIFAECTICRRRAREDGSRGLWVAGCHICSACERRLLSLSATDPEYPYFMSGLKKMWFLEEI